MEVRTFSKSNFKTKFFCEANTSKKLTKHIPIKAVGRDAFSTSPIDLPLRYRPFWSLSGPRHIGATKQLRCRKYRCRRVASSNEISLPPNNLCL